MTRTHLETIKHKQIPPNRTTKINDNINMGSTIAGSMGDNINMGSTIAGSMDDRS